MSTVVMLSLRGNLTQICRRGQGYTTMLRMGDYFCETAISVQVVSASLVLMGIFGVGTTWLRARERQVAVRCIMSKLLERCSPTCCYDTA